MSFFRFIITFNVWLVVGVLCYPGLQQDEPVTVETATVNQPPKTSEQHIEDHTPALEAAGSKDPEGPEAADSQDQGSTETEDDSYELERSDDYIQKTETAEKYKRKREMRKNAASRCMTEEYVRMEDEFGCQMCTCIYEKQIMLCSPFKCNGSPGHRLLSGLETNLYNDYVIDVATHFSEYECEPGTTLESLDMCRCKCVAKDILSCPPTCSIGRHLNG